MERTQIYLGAEDVALLKDAEERTGASRSELIRRAVRSAYGRGSSADKLAALKRSAGSWSHRTQSGTEYVELVRSELNDRLSQLYS